MMRVAQGVQDAVQGEIGLPVIMPDDAEDTDQQVTPPPRGTIEGQQTGGRYLQPLRQAGNTEARFIHVLDRSLFDVVANGRGPIRSIRRLSCAPWQLWWPSPDRPRTDLSSARPDDLPV